ncbi:putative peptidase C1-like protein F26E4.3 [Amphibalanus amphitrite]|uniref:Putative peptidase C1-like protein F26E4.3 n=1 Tax=Amphibalanus amphitrite TaxID=1232801 RepID=A0A6A4VRN0_AMPAM|nr:putative peptidase C1-like protein F26E4.3 [Amphibalanus amphitrite]
MSSKCEQVSDTEAMLMCETQQCLVQEDLIQDINYNSAYGWTASNYSQFWGRKLNTGLKYLLGTNYPNDMITQMYPVTKIYDPRELPRSFDARDKPEWSGLIGPVQDQGWCGASWAFSTASTAADRVAIQSPERRRVHLSEQNIIDCGYLRRDGCEGGNLDRAWNYLRRYGVAEAECYPYESGSTQTKGMCRTPRRSRSPHELTCTNGTRVSLGRRDMIGMQPPYRIASEEQDIMHELYHSGPVQAIMQVHEDFFAYRTGVYRVTGLRSSSRTAYHSVRILGWGEETGDRGQQVKYWIVANSWGRQWGEDGLFRIVRGKNEADIESFVVGSWAKPRRGGRRRSRGYASYRRSRRHHSRSERARAKRHHTVKE